MHKTLQDHLEFSNAWQSSQQWSKMKSSDDQLDLGWLTEAGWRWWRPCLVLVLWNKPGDEDDDDDDGGNDDDVDHIMCDDVY